MIHAPQFPDYLDPEFKKQLEEIFKPQNIKVNLTDFPEGTGVYGEARIKNTTEFNSEFEVIEFLYQYSLGGKDSQDSEKAWLKKHFGSITDKLDKLYADNPLAVLIYIISPIKAYNAYKLEVNYRQNMIQEINNEFAIRTGKTKRTSNDKYDKKTDEELQKLLQQRVSVLNEFQKQSPIAIPKTLLKQIEGSKTNAASGKDNQNRYYAKEFKLDGGISSEWGRGKSDDIIKQEYLKQMAAMAVGQSISRDKKAMHVKKSYAIDNPLYFQVQSAHQNYKNLSGFFINTTKFDKIKDIIKKGLGVDDKIAAQIISDYMSKSYTLKKSFIEISFLNAISVIKSDERILGSVLDSVIRAELYLDDKEIEKIFLENKVKILNNSGQIEEVEIDYESLAKALVMSAVLGDKDTTGAYFSNMGGHIENGKLMFHKIDFGYALDSLKLNMLDVKNGKITLDFSDGQFGGNKYS